jgi:hypothetical protein
VSAADQASCPSARCSHFTSTLNRASTDSMTASTRGPKVISAPRLAARAPFHDQARLLRHLTPTLRADAASGPSARITQPPCPARLTRDATHLQAARQLLRSLLRRPLNSGNAREP